MQSIPTAGLPMPVSLTVGTWVLIPTSARGPAIGRYGQVFQAYDAKTKRSVAVKVYRLLMYEGEEELVATETVNGYPRVRIREIDLLRRIRHPNIVRLLDIVSAPQQTVNASFPAIARQGTIYKVSPREELLIFEFVETTLFHAMREYNGIGLPFYGSGMCPALHIATQLVSALAYLHRKKVYHRDIKPDNILIDRKKGYVIKLCDFGMAREVPDGSSVTSHTFGAPGYRAPEVCRQAHERSSHMTYDAAIDMWACGVVLLEVLLCSKWDALVKDEAFSHMVDQTRPVSERRIMYPLPKKDKDPLCCEPTNQTKGPHTERKGPKGEESNLMQLCRICDVVGPDALGSDVEVVTLTHRAKKPFLDDLLIAGEASVTLAEVIRGMLQGDPAKRMTAAQAEAILKINFK